MGQSLPRLETILEDDHLVAVVKPAGLPTANAPRGEPSVFAMLRDALPEGAFLGVVSRLDAAVSGVLVLAKTRSAAADLSRQFRERQVSKVYDAVVEGRFPAALGTWVDWHDRIERHEQQRRSSLLPAVRRDGRRGRTADDEDQQDGADDPPGAECHVRARVVRRAGEISLVELEPTTGRRHQLRAQLAGHGCPIVGDRVYGARLPFPTAGRPAIALHARSLGFVHPCSGRPVELRAGWPTAWAARFPSLGPEQTRRRSSGPGTA